MLLSKLCVPHGVDGSLNFPPLSEVLVVEPKNLSTRQVVFRTHERADRGLVNCWVAYLRRCLFWFAKAVSFGWWVCLNFRPALKSA